MYKETKHFELVSCYIEFSPGWLLYISEYFIYITFWIIILWVLHAGENTGHS